MRSQAIDAENKKSPAESAGLFVDEDEAAYRPGGLP
jgi:hypothetical protein